MSLRFSANPVNFVRTLVKNRDLLSSLSRREIESKYRGTNVGLLWAVLNPLIMLSVYTFFFTAVLKSRWPGVSSSSIDFSLILFPGLLVFSFFSECVSKAPLMVMGNQSYVKKIIFPLETLPVTTIVAATVHTAIGFMIWIVYYLVVKQEVHLSWLTLWMPFIPLALLTLGICWMLAALGVFFRDITHIVTGVLGALMFLSPIFFPLSAVPESYRRVITLNPITVAVEQVREILYHGQFIDIRQWSIYLLISLCVAWIGLVVFQRTRGGFADVV